jgi:hypothetical protein
VLLVSSIAVISLFASATPWYELPACDTALQQVHHASVEEADASIETLKRGGIEERACGYWLSALLSEYRLAFEGHTAASLSRREKALHELYSFGKKYGSRPHLSDLMIEARVRRIRMLFENGERTDALSEARRVSKMIQDRPPSDSPTFTYARSLVDLAMNEAGWAARTVLSMAGIHGDPDRGRATLKQMVLHQNAYQDEAMFALRHFAESSPGEAYGYPHEFSQKLFEKFPENPQFAYDYAQDLTSIERCQDALKVLKRPTQALEKAPNLYGNRVRAKLFVLMGRCALNTGDHQTAARYTDLAEKQKYAELSEEISELRARL